MSTDNRAYVLTERDKATIRSLDDDWHASDSQWGGDLHHAIALHFYAAGRIAGLEEGARVCSGPWNSDCEYVAKGIADAICALVKP